MSPRIMSIALSRMAALGLIAFFALQFFADYMVAIVYVTVTGTWKEQSGQYLLSYYKLAVTGLPIAQWILAGTVLWFLSPGIARVAARGMNAPMVTDATSMLRIALGVVGVIGVCLPPVYFLGRLLLMLLQTTAFGQWETQGKAFLMAQTYAPMIVTSGALMLSSLALFAARSRLAARLVESLDVNE